MIDDREVGFAWQIFNLNWFPIILMGAVLACVTACTDFSLEPVAFGVTVGIGLSLMAITYGSARMCGDPKLIFWFGSTAQMIVLTAIAGPLSYVANALSWPLQDKALLLIDRAIGVDPQLIATFLNDHSWLVNYLNTGYGLIKWPLLGIPIILSLRLQLVRLQEFVLSFNIALVVTIAISTLMPAIGTYYGLGVSPERVFPLVDSSRLCGATTRYHGIARRLAAPS